MLGKWTQCLRSHRNREDYRNQLRRQAVEIAQKDKEILRLRRKLADVERFVREALA